MSVWHGLLLCRVDEAAMGLSSLVPNDIYGAVVGLSSCLVMSDTSHCVWDGSLRSV